MSVEISGGVHSLVHQSHGANRGTVTAFNVQREANKRKFLRKLVKIGKPFHDDDLSYPAHPSPPTDRLPYPNFGQIVETFWQSNSNYHDRSACSIREALNILAAEGFVHKGSGRTATVTKLSEEDIAHSYELRAVLEGYAARIVAQKQPDLSELDQILADMRSAIECQNFRAFYERDLHFHLVMVEKTGNRMLEQLLKRIIVPLFAFVVIRVYRARNAPDQWMKSLDQHKRIIEALRTGDPVFAEHLVANSINTFFAETKQVVAEASR